MPLMGNEKRCRACHGTDLVQFMDFGEMPLANGFLKSPDEPEKKYPLTVDHCANCGMVQLGQVVPAEVLYQDYKFFTGSSRRMVEHYTRMIEELCSEYMPHGGLTAEIGCNDLEVLQAVDFGDGSVIGIDPAAPDVPYVVSGISTIRQLFTENVAKSIERRAHLIVANNVLGHVDDLDDFLRGVKHLLHPDGVFVFEVPYWPRTCADAAYSQIYAEHLSYFSFLPLSIALDRNGLVIADDNFFEVHGGTIRITAKHKNINLSSGPKQFHKFRLDACQHFAERALTSRRMLLSRLDRFKIPKRKFIAYSASAKGSVVLNYCDIGTDIVPYVIDSTPAKQGMYVPGTHQKIVAPESVNLNDYDAILQLGWAHDAEIRAKHPEFNGEWILPHGEI